jgi:murein DD-endopeptidase MepM/ murein hydrolase activator NlpD
MMERMRMLRKRLFTPVTILLVPHSRTNPLSFRAPVFAVAGSAILCLVGTAFVAAVFVRAVEYDRMRDRLTYLSGQFHEMRGTMLSLKHAEQEFRRIFAVRSKSAVLESVDYSGSGSLDMEVLQEQIEAAMESVADIRKYLAEQKDIYLSTPAGMPVEGTLSSAYGIRKHPVRDAERFHTGVDISIPVGTRVRTTADGIVSFAGWTENSGIVVVVEHGNGFSTAYAHNRKATVRIGDRLRRGDMIALSGSTGISTGPHVHYEIWKRGRHVDPVAFLAGR